MSFFAKHATTAYLWFAVTAGCLPSLAQLKPEAVYSGALPYTLTLEVENVAGEHFVGGAFLGLRDGLAVTAWHVVHDARRVEARFADNHRVRVLGLVDKNEEKDLALLQLESTNGPSAPLCPDSPPVGSRVYVIGAPKGLEFSITEGLISQIRTVEGVRYYQVSTPITPGDSGGPVLNDRGQVIGLISWRKSNAENIGFAIPSQEVLRLNVSHPLKPWPPSIIAKAVPPVPLETATPVRGPMIQSSAVDSTESGLRAFQDFLMDHAGKHLTVIIEATDKEGRFSFDLPAAVVK